MSGLNVGSLTSHLTQGVEKSMQDVGAFAQNIDPTNPGDLLQMQMKMMRLTMITQLEAALTKSLEDALKSVTQRM